MSAAALVLALAHPVPGLDPLFGPSGGGHSALAGLSHPVTGLDHMLAMIAVGILSARLGGRAVWAVPAGFVAAMAAGGALGLAGTTAPLLELGVAASVLLLGAGIASRRKISRLPALLAVVAFGLLHGNAHGVELPAAANAVVYSLGFLTSTVGLHVMGALLGLLVIRRDDGVAWLSRLGLALSAAGLALIASRV
jgi:urease accessory protein